MANKPIERTGTKYDDEIGMNTFCKTIGALLLAVNTIGCSGMMLAFVSDTELARRGEKAFEQSKAQCAQSSNREFVARVSCVSERLFESVGNTPGVERWEIITVQCDEANIVSFPGGKIAVNDGFARVAKTPDELAAALAVSVSQITLEQAKQRIATELVLSVASFSATGVHVGDPAAMDQFSAQRLLEADDAGRTLMVEAGFDPAASVSLLHKVVEKS